MIYILYTIHVIVCLFLILVVLLQQGKGADLSVFGGGSTQTVFGARGAATFLHKMTVGAFIAFIVTTVGIGFLKSGAAQRTVMAEEAQEEAAAAEEAAASEVPEPAVPSEQEAPPGDGPEGEAETGEEAPPAPGESTPDQAPPGAGG